MTERAARAGVREAYRFFSMTPREICLLLTACRAKTERRQETLWLAARYAALAWHCPDRLPPPPAPRSSPMTDDEMKSRLLSWRGKEHTL